MKDDIRRAVHAEWRTVIMKRTSRRRTIVFGLAASVVVAMLAFALTLRSVAPPAAVAVAVVERVEGVLQIASAQSGTGPARTGSAIMAGETIVTNASAMAALRIGDRISVRLDGATSVAVLAPDRLELKNGSVYVDAGAPEGGYSALDIETVAGRVRHLGTQYQIRSQANSVTISVREGHIELAHSRGREIAVAGEQLVASPQGALTRRTLATDDPSWAWTMQVAPPFAIENQPLAAFLEWVARETGRTLEYASPSVEAAAAALRLRGSIASLTPEAALAAVLSTTQFEQLASDPDVIRIGERTHQ